ncbi:hypothetical protein E2562_026866, partial [Oryza meyeriana var. granulata]
MQAFVPTLNPDAAHGKSPTVLKPHHRCALPDPARSTRRKTSPGSSPASVAAAPGGLDAVRTMVGAVTQNVAMGDIVPDKCRELLCYGRCRIKAMRTLMSSRHAAASCGLHVGIVGGSVVTIIASTVAGAGEEASWSWSGASGDVDVIVVSMHACTPLCVKTWHKCSCAATVFAE